MEVCASIPAMGADLLREGHDLRHCTYLIASPAGETLLEIPFDELERPLLKERSRPFNRSRSFDVDQLVTRTREQIAAAKRLSDKTSASIVEYRNFIRSMEDRLCKSIIGAAGHGDTRTGL